MPIKSRRHNHAIHPSHFDSSLIPLRFSPEHLRQLLTDAAKDRSPYSDWQIVRWADRFWLDCEIAEEQGMPAVYSEAVSDILQDIWMQWDMFLANSFDLPTLKLLDYDTVRLPREWLVGWLERLDADGA